MEKFLNEDDNIGMKDASCYQEVNNKFLNLYSLSSNSKLAFYTFGIK
jgi:hypothetical protein